MSMLPELGGIYVRGLVLVLLVVGWRSNVKLQDNSVFFQETRLLLYDHTNE